jgi:2Fe-2S ferredoxin
MAAVGSLRVTFVQMDGVEKTVGDAEAGQSLMTVARANAVAGILGDCGGCCSCATCHVYVDPQWQERVGPPDEVEASTLDMVSDLQRPTSRLCCQITLRPELDGIRVEVAPAE